jgi:hypothetical protein
MTKKCPVCGKTMHLEPKKVLDVSVCYVCLHCNYWIPVPEKESST